MKQRFLGLIFLLIITLACTESKTPNILTANTIETNTTVKNSLSTLESDYYCTIQIGSDQEHTEYELRSSNALRKSSITTTFNILLSEKMYEKYPLDISFTKVQNTTNPKLVKGTYPLRTMTLEGQDIMSYFSIGERVISEQTYQKAAIDVHLLEDIEDSYVFLSNEPNEFTITSVKDIGQVDDSTFFTVGKQEVKGSAKTSLYSVATKEKLILKIDFKIIHEWTLSKNN